MRTLLSLLAIAAFAACPAKPGASKDTSVTPSLADTAAVSEPADTATAPEPGDTATATEPADTATATEPADTATTPEPADTAAPGEPVEASADEPGALRPLARPGRLGDAEKAELVRAAADFKRLLNEGRKLVKAGSYVAGVAKYKAALQLNPMNASVLGELGFAALQQGDLDRAEELTRRAISYSRSDKQLGALQYNMGQIAEKRGEPGDALVAYRASLVARPGNATVAGRITALEKSDVAPSPPVIYASLDAVRGARVVACLDYLNVWDGVDIPKDVDLEDAAAGVGPCSAEVKTRVAAPPGNAPVTEVAAIDAGGGLYTTVSLFAHVADGWILAATLFENEDSGCCGAYRSFDHGSYQFRDLVPGQGAEITLATRWEDQDSDMGDNYVYHQSYNSTVVCDIDAHGAPWCRALHTRELSYDGDLDDFLDDKGVKPRCWDVSFDGRGGYARKPIACDGGAAPPDAKTERGQIAKLPTL